MQIEHDVSTYEERTELSHLDIVLQDYTRALYAVEYQCYKTGGGLGHPSFERIIAGASLNTFKDDWSLTSGEDKI